MTNKVNFRDSSSSSTYQFAVQAENSQSRMRGSSAGSRSSSSPDLTKLALHLIKSNSTSEEEGIYSSKRVRQQVDNEVSKATICIPMSTFIKFIDEPVTSYKNWWKIVRKELLSRISETDLRRSSIENAIDITYARSLEHAGILQRIKKAQELLQGMNEHAFLDGFSNESNPEIFSKKINSLKQEECECLSSIIGKENAQLIIQKAGDSNALKAKLRAEIEAIVPIEKKRKELLRSLFVFKEKFDVANISLLRIPIAYLDYKEFSETFRAYYSGDPSLKKCFCFNKEYLAIPHFISDGIPEEDCEDLFVEWLISEVHAKMSIKLTKTPKELCEMFAMSPKIDQQGKLKKSICKAIQKEFTGAFQPEDLAKKLGSCFTLLQKEAISSDFGTQMAPFAEYASKYLLNQQGLKLNDAELVAKELINVYRRIYKLKEKQQAIPAMAMLKAMSFGSYATSARFLRDVLCLRFYGNQQDQYSLESNHGFITAYKIHFDPHSGSFDVTHIKLFDIVKGSRSSRKSNEKNVCGSFFVHWTVSGKLNSMDYSATLKLNDLQFDCPYDERDVVLDLFQTDGDKTPWGSYLEKKKEPLQ